MFIEYNRVDVWACDINFVWEKTVDNNMQLTDKRHNLLSFLSLPSLSPYGCSTLQYTR